MHSSYRLDEVEQVGDRDITICSDLARYRSKSRAIHSSRMRSRSASHELSNMPAHPCTIVSRETYVLFTVLLLDIGALSGIEALRAVAEGVEALVDAPSAMRTTR